MTDPPALLVRDVRHRYGDHEALAGVSLTVDPGEAFVLLGPNGSGKSTLFRLISTLTPIQSGEIAVHGEDAAKSAAAVRSLLGVVFQSPSLDRKLRVDENLYCHGRLYGLGGRELGVRVEEGLERFGVADRRRDAVETLSGGLQRRVELAKCLMHRPRLLLLDEPSTGLDPAARSDLWQALSAAREAGVTVVATTHLLEEAERATRIAILDRGELVALDTPTALQASVGGDAITLRTENADRLAEAIRTAMGVDASNVEGLVRLEANGSGGGDLAARVYAEFRDQIDELAIGRPTLEDVFLARTGRRFDTSNDTPL